MKRSQVLTYLTLGRQARGSAGTCHRHGGGWLVLRLPRYWAKEER